MFICNYQKHKSLTYIFVYQHLSLKFFHTVIRIYIIIFFFPKKNKPQSNLIHRTIILLLLKPLVDLLDSKSLFYIIEVIKYLLNRLTHIALLLLFSYLCIANSYKSEYIIQG